jgi:hypothetical protein
MINGYTVFIAGTYISNLPAAAPPRQLDAALHH